MKSFEFKGQSEGAQRHYQDSRKALQLKHPGIWKDKKPGQKVAQLSRQELSNGPTLNNAMKVCFQNFLTKVIKSI